MLMVFGKAPDNSDVERAILKKNDMQVNIISWGASVQDIRLKDIEHSLVLGYPDFAPYPQYGRNYGAIVGRVANRIANARLELDGETYQLEKNYLDKHTLHGGTPGTNQRNWKITEQGDDFVTLSLLMADGDKGFPGKLTITAHYQLLANNTLEMTLTASSDKTTVCNLANHSYFKLDALEDTSQHQLQVMAEHVLDVDDELIPTGKLKPVTNSALDFRQANSLEDRAALLDHNYCLSDSKQPLRPVATLLSQHSGLQMTLETTETGLQVYGGVNLNVPEDISSHHGQGYQRCAGIALEAQGWPDASSHSHFPSIQLEAGEVYQQVTRYVFQTS